MSLNIPSQYETILQDAVASGAFASPEDALRHALELLTIEQKASSRSADALHREDQADQFRVWAESHSPVSHFVDDSRESIY
ncbi:hypothetical protein M4951_09530 [Blastopirellula sp. J2-11]|uniref:hypothetical protein n=1 Tax=Blastopirellula sp. J2-11 TaxID=2943192 RepID=UPI0021C9EE15|nr:hypothetical protein [Blastopirellula sp. J2-11]UUO08544.1 hypothetical protein M4951_09530 [Blastopirellula sp. J2-11]